MPQHIPLSVVLSPPQLAWLDAQRQQGNLSRSAALRIALDRLIKQDQAEAAHMANKAQAHGAEDRG